MAASAPQAALSQILRPFDAFGQIRNRGTRNVRSRTMIGPPPRAC